MPVWSLRASEIVDTVVVCSTEPIAIEGLRSLLESAEGMRVVATETLFTGEPECTEELRPTILVLDKAFGLRGVMDAPAVLRKADCQSSVVVWGNMIPEAEALRFLQAGAAGVLRKTAARLEAARLPATGGAGRNLAGARKPCAHPNIRSGRRTLR